MTFFTQARGIPVLRAEKINSTSAFTLIDNTSEGKLNIRFESIMAAAAAGGSGGNFELYLRFNSVNYHLIQPTAVAAGASLQFSGHSFPIPRNWKLMCKASAADVFDVTLVTAEISPTSDGGEDIAQVMRRPVA